MCQVEEGLRHGWSRDNRKQRGQLGAADWGPGLLHRGPEVGGQAYCGELTLWPVSLLMTLLGIITAPHSVPV